MLFHIAGSKRPSRRGFTLVELAIVLAVAAVLFAGLWRLMASGNTQLRDQSAADQHRQLISAVSSFLTTSEGQAILKALRGNISGRGNRTLLLPLPTSNADYADCQDHAPNVVVAGTSYPTRTICDSLPLGFENDTTNSYGQTYRVVLRKDATVTGTAPKNYSFLVYTAGGDTIPDTSGGRIASMIGNDGGFFYSTEVCGSTASKACGAFGAWVADFKTDYDSTADAEKGHIVSRTYSGDISSIDTLWLARKAASGLSSTTVSVVGGTAADLNTIQTNIYMGSVAGSLGKIYGAIPVMNPTTQKFGGEINYLRNLILGRTTTANGESDPSVAALRVLSECDTPDTATCPNIMYVKGNVYVKGLLDATNFRAEKVTWNQTQTTSDIRLKKDLKPMENILDRMSQIKGYEFTMKEDEKRKYGLIAQELEKPFPLVVRDMGDGYKGVDYPMMVGPLVQAVNALSQENKKLKADLTALAEEVKALKSAGSKKKK